VKQLEILTSAELIFDNGNKHMSTKFRFLGKAEQSVVKYIIAKLRKYHGSFFEKYKAIASELQVSTKTVQRAVKHAEQLGIFQVSERFEPTLDGKMRKTTNLIQLLSYAPFEFINGVVKVVRTVKKAVKLVDIAKKIVANTKPAKQQNKPKNSKPVRTEVLPSWFEDSTKEIEAKQAKEVVQDISLEEKKRLIEEKLKAFRK
jgi:hypothetical protein